MEEPDYYAKFYSYYKKLLALNVKLFNLIGITKENKRFDELIVVGQVRMNILRLEMKMDKAVPIMAEKILKALRTNLKEWSFIPQRLPWFAQNPLK